MALLVGGGIATTPAAAERDLRGVITTEGNVDAFQVQLGDCFNDEDIIAPNETVEITNVAGIPCSEPHDNEVYAIISADLSAFPGREEMADIAFESCLEQFEPFVGKSYETSLLDISSVPTLVE